MTEQDNNTVNDGGSPSDPAEEKRVETPTADPSEQPEPTAGTVTESVTETQTVSGEDVGSLAEVVGSPEPSSEESNPS